MLLRKTEEEKGQKKKRDHLKRSAKGQNLKEDTHEGESYVLFIKSPKEKPNKRERGGRGQCYCIACPPDS